MIQKEAKHKMGNKEVNKLDKAQFTKIATLKIIKQKNCEGEKFSQPN